ncbi:MAG TPA: PaaI family thioesterase [Jatrophihabitantaceae bacterium]
MANPIEMGVVKVLGIRVVETSADLVRLEWDVTPDHHQPYGIVHGGVHCTAIETAASVGAALWFGDRGRVVGVSNQTDFLRAVSEGTLSAVATPIHRGRSQQLWLVEITDEQHRLIARGQVRLQNLTAS